MKEYTSKINHTRAAVAIGAGIALAAAAYTLPEQIPKHIYTPPQTEQPTNKGPFYDPCTQAKTVFDPDCMDRPRPIIERPDISDKL